MTGGDAGPTVWPVPVWSGVWLECLDGASPVCVVPRLFEQARWCTRTSPVLVIPAKAGIHFGRPVPHGGGFPPPRGWRVGMGGGLFAPCLYRLGNGWSVWMVPGLVGWWVG